MIKDFLQEKIRFSLRDPVYHYVVYPESASHGSFNLKKFTAIYAWEEICNLYRNSSEENMVVSGMAATCKAFCLVYYSDPVFLENRCLDELIIKYRKIQNIYFKELIRTKKYKELITGIVFGICPRLYLEVREKKKSLLAR